jgi:hypothetical protein
MSLNAEVLKKEFFDRQQIYYNTLINDIYDDYVELDESYFKGKAVQNAIDKLNLIDKYLQSLNQSNPGESPITILRNKINAKFQSNGSYLEMVDDLHYSVYKNGVLRVNQLLKSNVLIFNNKTYFEQYVKAKEDNLVNFIKEHHIHFSISDIKSSRGETIPKSVKERMISEKFKIDASDIFNGKGREASLKLYNEDNTPSELLNRYLWSRNLLISQYANLTTKDVFLHPIKAEFKEINLSNDN